MLNKNYIVSKSNLMAEMRNCNYSLGEQRLLAVFLSRINPKDPLKQKTVTFTFDEFTSLLDLKSENRAYWKKSFDSLVNKTIKFEYSTDGNSAWTTCIVFSDVTMLRDEKTEELTIKLTANETVLPLIFDLSEFTSYHLSNCLRLSSSNQIRMYELLKQYEKLKTRTISIEDLKEMLGMSINEYPIWERFKTKVLEVCKKALKENTDIYFEYEPIKRGRKFVKVKFLIFKNKSYKDPLNLDEFIGNQTNEDVIEVDFNDVTSSAMENCEPEPTLKPNDDYIPEPPPENSSNYDYDNPEPIEQGEHKFKDSFLDEFNREEVNSFYQLIKHKGMTEEQNDIFIQTQYNQMLVASSKNKISNAYKHLTQIIKNEIVNNTPTSPQKANPHNKDYEKIYKEFNNTNQSNQCNTTDNNNQNIYDGFNGDIDNYIQTFIKNKEVQRLLYRYIDSRKQIKRPMNDNMLIQTIEQLNRHNVNEQISMLDTAIGGGYQALMSPKQNNSNKKEKRDYSHYKSAPRELMPDEEINF